MTGTLTAEDFSYAAPEDPWVRRALIRAIERLTGQPRLKRLYDDYRAHRSQETCFWDSAVQRLELNIVCNEEALARLPATGPLVVVANHPFGVLDGLVLSHLVGRVRKDFLVLVHALLTRAEEIRPHLLPIDFRETPEALKTNLKTRALAKHHLMKGGCLIVFPAGGVSTTPTLWHRRAVDAEWKTFTGRLIVQSRASVVPVYFAGQNSRLFQIASHISQTLRLSLLFREVRERIGSEVQVRIGEVLPYREVASFADRRGFMTALREMTYALGAEAKRPA
jgi:putative hemolysin